MIGSCLLSVRKLSSVILCGWSQTGVNIFVEKLATTEAPHVATGSGPAGRNTTKKHYGSKRNCESNELVNIACKNHTTYFEDISVLLLFFLNNLFATPTHKNTHRHTHFGFFSYIARYTFAKDITQHTHTVHDRNVARSQCLCTRSLPHAASTTDFAVMMNPRYSRIV